MSIPYAPVLPAATRERLLGGVVVQCAMDEEVAPFLERTEALGEPFDFGRARFHPRVHEGRALLVVRSGIGLVNAAGAATSALAAAEPRALISAGSAGGLRADVEVGDLAIGESYTYTDADATAFGYERGQVPGMPERYRAAPALLEAARALEPEGGRHLVGQMLAGGSFVTAANVKDTREAFPDAVSTDMETTAIAQVADSTGVDFLSLRGISDLCGPRADQDFHMAVEVVAARSAAAALAVIAASRA
ncbi:5'-methylthioadenosine/S-adenosylhomocysteine nucleosidase [Rothia sp. AR01]|uniref:adenosylhomocysteine nucleosidase n=1 Tax=Rothia santali TaxID=2949643 RepID=A0A9X2HG23_9MICC|nr:5'-methylthioadenosine/S-adenosylhomocysteine nucleosidase [Rothia santali]MCP3425056.1 5'-methylthioadenosine/S-adenosylhomocysteine nucleosidase [Rothia santali]